MGKLQNCEPQDLFAQFEKLIAVPRGSGKTDGMVRYLLDFAAERGLESEYDEANNVVIRKAASAGYENAGTVILQAHHDMVWASAEGSDFDFEKDQIELIVENDWIRANGTTLGGDDGIGVAIMLAILDDDTISHPALEMLFTADEEIGMPGAFAFDCSKLKGRKLINLDSEFEDVLLCSCAGGVNLYNTIPLEKGDASGVLIRIRVKDMKGGHSGVEIDKGRGNSIVFMARLLNAACLEASVQLAELSGGVRETAIAPYGKMAFLTDEANVGAVLEAVGRTAESIKKEYATTELSMDIEISNDGNEKCQALSYEDTKRCAAVLMGVPNGVQVMSADMEGLVQTSVNMGIVQLKEEGLWFSNTVRSALASQKQWICERIEGIVALAGGTSEKRGEYPGWGYNPNSVTKNILIEAYRELYDKEPSVQAIHAGLECGVFADRIKELDCVSIGPQMEDVHTASERLSISSSAKTFCVVKKALELCKE